MARIHELKPINREVGEAEEYNEKARLGRVLDAAALNNNEKMHGTSVILTFFWCMLDYYSPLCCTETQSGKFQPSFMSYYIS